MLHYFSQLYTLLKMRRLFPHARLHSPLFIERFSGMAASCTLAEGVEILPYGRITGPVSLERYSYAGTGVEWYASPQYPITVGAWCSIAPGVLLVSSHHHHPESVANFPVENRVFENEDRPTGASIRIGNDVWIGARAIILPGVTIGDGAIVGAGSIVTSGTVIKPYEVWAGNPAKKIKDRFPKEALERMKMMTWWEWDVAEIKKNREMFVKPVM